MVPEVVPKVDKFHVCVIYSCNVKQAENSTRQFAVCMVVPMQVNNA